MNFKENRPLAFIVLAAAILLSILVQGSFGMISRRADAQTAFAEGAMHEMTVRCAAQGELLGQMAALHLHTAALAQQNAATAAMLGTEEYLALPGQLQSLSQQLKATTDANAALTILTDLHAGVEKTYTALDMMQISDADFRNIKLAYYDFVGAIDILVRDGESPDSYADLARSFNKDISGFPANLLRGVLGVDPLTVYGG